MQTHRIIIDCDPGVDDAIAILLAIASPEIELLGITTVVGNTELELTARNALRICALAGRSDIPVFAGCARPLMGPFERWWPSSHGDNGLGGVRLPEPRTRLQGEHAVDFIIRMVTSHPGEITLCPIGPLTNIALAMTREPQLASLTRSIVFMGGAAFVPGNSTPLAEFNFLFDPEAAKIVMASGAPLTMLGLDVTRQIRVGKHHLSELSRSGPIAGVISAMLSAYGATDPCLHDPCVLAYLLAPELFATEQAHVDVLTTPAEARGAVVAAVSERHRRGRHPNCNIVTGGSVSEVTGLILGRVSDAAAFQPPMTLTG